MVHSRAAADPLKPVLRLVIAAFVAGFVGYLLTAAWMIRSAPAEAGLSLAHGQAAAVSHDL